MNGRNMYSIPWHCNDFKNSEICEHMTEDGPKSLFNLLMRIVLAGPGLVHSGSGCLCRFGSLFLVLQFELNTRPLLTYGCLLRVVSC